MFAEYRVIGADQCLVLPEDVTPAQAASCFVNPLTALGMIDTMRLDGHHALVHTAGVESRPDAEARPRRRGPLVNVVRRPQQVELLRGLSASFVCDTSDATFMPALTEALAETDATIAFDAIGGGTLAGDILSAMEVAQSRTGTAASVKGGSTVHKQVYVYGGLDRSPIEPSPVLARLERRQVAAAAVPRPCRPRPAQALRERAANEVTTTFATSYTAVVSLERCSRWTPWRSTRDWRRGRSTSWSPPAPAGERGQVQSSAARSFSRLASITLSPGFDNRAQTPATNTPLHKEASFGARAGAPESHTVSVPAAQDLAARLDPVGRARPRDSVTPSTAPRSATTRMRFEPPEHEPAGQLCDADGHELDAEPQGDDRVAAVKHGCVRRRSPRAR